MCTMCIQGWSLVKRVYAIASIIGAIGYYLMYHNGVNQILASAIAVSVVFAIRICATVFKWDLPKVRLKDNVNK